MGKDNVSYLITGGCGFIGSYVVRDLLEEGAKVVIYDFKIDQGIVNQVVDEKRLKDVIFIQGEVTDFIHLVSILKAHKVSKIIHLASPLTYTVQENPPLGVDMMCKGTLNILEAAKILEVEKVVWASSMAVFGPPERYPKGKIKNDAPHWPESLYGACKSMSEYLATHYADKFGVDSIGLRFTLVYGPGKFGTAKGAFATEIIRRAALGEPYEVPFSDETTDWQYVEDISRLTVAASKVKRTKTRAFNTQGDLRPVKEVIDYIRSFIPELKFTLKPGPFGMPMDYDTTPLEKEIGFKPKYSMEEGVLKALNTFRRLAGLKEVKR